MTVMDTILGAKSWRFGITTKGGDSLVANDHIGSWHLGRQHHSSVETHVGCYIPSQTHVRNLTLI